MELLVQTWPVLRVFGQAFFPGGYVRHLAMGYVSPQYHVVFDDLFETVFSSGANDALVDSICENLYVLKYVVTNYSITTS